MDTFRGKSELLLKIDYLEDVIEEKGKIIVEKDREIASIKDVLSSYRCKNVVDEEVYLDLKTRHDSLSTNYEDYRVKNNRLKKEESSYLVEIENLTNLLLNKEDEIERCKHLKGDLKVLRTENQILSDEVSDQRSLINNQMEEIKNYKDYADKMEKEIKEIREQFIPKKVNDSFNKSCSFLGTSLHDFSMPEIGENMADIKINQLELEKEELLTEKNTLQQRLTNCLNENNEMNNKLAENDIKINNLDKSCSEALDKIAELNSLLEHSSQQLQILKGEMVNQQNNFDRNISEYSSINEKLTLQHNEDLAKIDKLEQNKKYYESKLNELNTLYDSKTKESNELKELNIQILNDKKMLDEQLTHNKEIIKDIETKNITNERKISELSNLLHQKLQEFDQLQNVNKTLINENNEMNNKLTENDIKINNLDKSCSDALDKIAELNSLLEHSSQQLQSLKGEMVNQQNNFDRNISEYSLVNEKLTLQHNEDLAKIDKLEQNIKYYESKLNELNTLYDSKTKESNELKELNIQILNDKKMLNEQLTHNKEIIKDIETKNITNERKIFELSNLLNQKLQEFDQLQNVNKTLINEKETLDSHISKHISSLEELTVQNNSNLAIIEDLKQDNITSYAIISEVNSILNDKSQEIEQSKGYIQMLTRDNTDLQQQLVKQKTLINNLESNAKEYANKIVDMDTKSKAIEHKLNEMVKTNDELISANKSLENKVTNYISEISVANKKIQFFETSIDQLVETKENLVAQINSISEFKSAEVHQLQKSNQELWLQIEILTNQINEHSATDDELTKSKLELEDVKNELNHFQNLYQEISDSKSVLSQQVIQQKSYIEKLKNSNNAAKDLQKKNNDLADSNHLLNDQISNLISNNDNVTKQLNENEISIESYEQMIENYKNLANSNAKDLKKKDLIIRKLNYDLEIEQKSFAQERKTKERLLKENSILENDIKKLLAENKAKNFIGNSGLSDCSMKTECNLSQSSSICRSKVSLNSYTLPQGTGNKFEMADEEGQFMDPNEIETSKLFPNNVVSNENRISTLMQRNSLLKPHLRSTYPIELQTVTFDENSIRSGSQSGTSSTTSLSSHNSLCQSSNTFSSIENIPSKVPRRAVSNGEQQFKPIKSKYLDNKKQTLNASSGITLKSITPSKIFKRVVHSKQRTWTPSKK